MILVEDPGNDFPICSAFVARSIREVFGFMLMAHQKTYRIQGPENCFTTGPLWPDRPLV